MYHKLNNFRVQIKKEDLVFGSVKIRQQAPRINWDKYHGANLQHSRQFRQGAINGSNNSQEYNLNEYVEATVKEVKDHNGQFKVHLRLNDEQASELPIYIGNSEFQSLRKVLHEQVQGRPFTHDLFYTVLEELGYRVSHVMITELKQTTFYARVFVMKKGLKDVGSEESQMEFDARPSDAINLAYRFNATIFVNKSLINQMQTNYANKVKYMYNFSHKQDMYSNCREELLSYRDPVFFLDLQRDIAVMEDRFEDALQICKQRDEVIMRDKIFSSMCAMESALQNGRVEEAIKIHNTIEQLKTTLREQQSNFQQDDFESSFDQQ